MNIYSLLKIYRRIHSPKLRLLGVMAMHLAGKRYLSVFLDPVRACNLRCQMCYFSDPEVRKGMHGKFTDDDLEAIAHALFHRTLRLQIGCGAEPTAGGNLPPIIKRAKFAGVPFVSLTTNGNLLGKQQLVEIVEAGLDEIIISAHGFTKQTYERLMVGAKFEKFLELLQHLSELKKQYPKFKIRLNVTVNEDNVVELPLIMRLFHDSFPDTIQLRPVQRLGQTAYSNFSLKALIEGYNDYIKSVADFCRSNNIMCIFPSKQNLLELQSENYSEEESHINHKIDSLAYFYFAPYTGWENKFNPYKETFEQYCHRTHRTRSMLATLLPFRKTPRRQEGTTKMFNYEVI